jgi:hypothetical protein
VTEKMIPEGYNSGVIIGAWTEFAEDGSDDQVACFEVRLDGYPEETTDGDVTCFHKMFGLPEKEAKTAAVLGSLGLDYEADNVPLLIAERTIGRRVRVGTFHNTTTSGKVYVNHYIVIGKARAKADQDKAAEAWDRKRGVKTNSLGF